MAKLNSPSINRSWADIDLSALKNNICCFKKLVGKKTGIMAAVKANAYGHGSVQVAQAVLAAGASSLGVANCLEGQELRKSGISAPIQVLGTLLPEEIEEAVHYNLTISVHESYLARLISLAAVSENKTAKIQLKTDTGMGRLGVQSEKLSQLAVLCKGLPNLVCEGLFSHFAAAVDRDYTLRQLNKFNLAWKTITAAGWSNFITHTANSTATILYPQSHFDLVRPGLAIYGMHENRQLEKKFPLQQVMHWRSLVIQIKDYPQGCSLGYGCTYKTSRKTQIAILPVGYADGYRRGWSNKANVLINGKRAPVAGRVSMDYIMVDITDIENVNVGSIATLLGSDREAKITALELAELLPETIPYEITTCIGKRVERRFITD